MHKITISESYDADVYYRSAGDPAASPILLLHGFPDDCRSMDGLLSVLGGAGYYAVAPSLPGYFGSRPPVHNDYGLRSLAQWVHDLSLRIFPAPGRPVVMGHDWGAVIGYAAAAVFPDHWAKLVTMSVPPPLCLLRNLRRHPTQLLRSFYMLLFQIPRLPEWILATEPLDAVGFFWRRWSPGWTLPGDHVVAVSSQLATPDGAYAALAYYRHLIPRSRHDWPRFYRDWSLIHTQIATPTLILIGDNDGCISTACFSGFDERFSGSCELERVAGAGHFVHLEAPEVVSQRILTFLNPPSLSKR